MSNKIYIKNKGKIAYVGELDIRVGEATVSIGDVDNPQENKDVQFPDNFDLASYVTGAAFDAATKKINLKHGNTVIGTVDLGALAKESQLTTLANNLTYDADARKIYLKNDAEVLAEISSDDFIVDGEIGLGEVEDQIAAMDEAKADKNGYYQSLTAGTAENLVGRGSVSAEFTRRTSGGAADIGTGAAAIKKIKGNTIVWNQLVQNGNFANGTTNWGVSNVSFSAADNILTCVASAVNGYARSGNIVLVASHKYYVALSVKCDSNKIEAILRNGTTSETYFSHTFAGSGSWERASGIASATNAGNSTLRFRDTRSSDWTNYYIRDVICIDLTQMGLDTLTASEFEALFPLNYYAYNAGSLLSLTATGLVTTGFNQWDEEWELGTYNGTTGQKQDATNMIRSKNLIKVFPSTSYYAKATGGINIYFYDSAQNYLGASSVIYVNDTTFTTPVNAAFMAFRSGTGVTTYNNDICINISWSGVRNGEYEPYEKHTLPLNLTSLTSGGTAIFPDGLKSAGSIFDEVDATKAFKRVGVVDLGNLTWSYDNGLLRATVSDMKIMPDIDTTPSMICPRLEIVVPKNVSGHNMTISSNNGVVIGQLIAYADAYVADPSGFKTAMSGVYLYYELATPVEYVLDSTLNLSYYVNDFGTEEITPENGPVPSTAPIIYEVLYAMNAVDTLRNLPKNYIGKDSMDNILTALKTAGIIADYTLTFDSDTNHYTCTITAPTE